MSPQRHEEHEERQGKALKKVDALCGFLRGLGVFVVKMRTTRISYCSESAPAFAIWPSSVDLTPLTPIAPTS